LDQAAGWEFQLLNRISLPLRQTRPVPLIKWNRFQQVWARADGFSSPCAQTTFLISQASLLSRLLAVLSPIQSSLFLARFSAGGLLVFYLSSFEQATDPLLAEKLFVFRRF
jgi:hypothetical protein